MKQSKVERAIILANGELHDVGYARSLTGPGDSIVAANGGTRLAWELGIVPGLVVGDSDSLPPHLQRWLDEHEVPRQSHPVAKDATDLELALRHVAAQDIRHVLLLGLTGNRTDHMLANFSILAMAEAAQLRVEVVVGHEHLYLVYDELVLAGEPGQTVSLLPWGGDAEGVMTVGLRWELAGETMRFGSARGMSNIMEGTQARVALTAGRLLVCQQWGTV